MTTPPPDREALLRKIRACLRLAKSQNANEAATAMRQAQKLMEQHGLSESDVVESDLRTCQAGTRSRGGDVPGHIWLLAVWVGRAFTCTAVQDGTQPGQTLIEFVGRDARPEVAAYAFSVLRRQLERDIAKHTARVRKRANKMRRAESFGVGWVGAVRHKLGLTDLPEAERDAHAAYHGERVRTTQLQLATGSWRDRAAGLVAGSQAALHPAMAGTAPRAIERHS